MKAIFTAFITLAATVALAQESAADKPMTETFKVDTGATKVEWVGKKVTGKHNGNVSVKEGIVQTTGDTLSGGTIVVDLNSIKVLDIPVTEESNGKLVGHLKSPDFFDVAKYPTATLVIKSSEKIGKSFKVKGELTMIGKTNPIEFTATNGVKTADSLTAKADIVIDRTKWGLKYGSGSFFKGLGDKAINNEFTLSINLSAKK